mgnify:CR=1 FL=1
MEAVDELTSKVDLIASQFIYTHDTRLTKEQNMRAKEVLKELYKAAESADELLSVFGKLGAAAGLVSGFSSWGLLALSAETIAECPFYTFTVGFSATTSLIVVVLISLIQFLAAKVSKLDKADFLKDVSSFGCSSFLLFIGSMPAFLLSFLAKIICVMDTSEVDTGVAGRLLIAMLSSGFCATIFGICRIMYIYHPKLLLLVATFFSPLMPAIFYIFPVQLAELGSISSSRGVTISSKVEEKIFGKAEAEKTKGGRRIYVDERES